MADFIIIYSSSMRELFDVICFHSDCKIDKKQLVCSWASESEFHFQNRHELVAIHRGSDVFKKLKTSQEPLKLQKEACISMLRKQHQEKKAQLIRQLDEYHQKIENNILYYFQMSHKSLQFQHFYSNLTQQTEQTDMYLTAANWLYESPNLTLPQYLEQAIKKSIHIHEGLFQKMNKNISEDGILKLKPSAHYNVKQEPQFLSYKVREQFMKQMRQNEPRSQNMPKKIPKKSERQRNPGLVADICKELIELGEKKQKIGFRTISMELRQKLAHQKNLYKQLNYIFRAIFGQIEEQVIKVLKFRKIPTDHKAFIQPKFKDYQRWLRRQDAGILTNCLRCFLDIETNEPIGFYQTYVIYINFVISIRKIINDKKKYEINYNTEPTNIRIQIACLYFHYGNLKTVVELLNQKYHLSPKYKNPDIIIHEFKQLLKQSIKRFNFKDGNLLVERLEAQYDSQGSNWIKIREKIITFEVSRLNGNSKNIQNIQEEREEFEQLIKKLAEQKEIVSVAQKYQHKNALSGFQKEVVVIDSDDDYHLEYSFEQRPCNITKNSKWQVKKNTKVVKLQVLESYSEDMNV